MDEYARSLLEASLDPLVMISPGGKITDVNEATVKVTGVARNILIGSDFCDYFTNAVKARDVYQQVFSNGFVSDYALTIRHIDGHLTDVLYNASVYRDAAGNVLGVFAAARDITALKQAAERARVADQRFRATVESAPAAMTIVDQHGKISLVNLHMEKVFGYSRDELLGLTVDQLVPARFRRAHPALREGYFVKPESRPMGAGRELFGVRKDGTEFPVEIGLSPIETEEGSFALATIVDISERLAAQTQRLEAVRREVLLKEIHHRVKNNLAVISSLFYLQSSQTTDEHTRKLFQESQDRVRSMALVHEKLYCAGSFDSIDFADYAQDLARQLVRAYSLPTRTVGLHTDLESVSLNIDLAVPCALILTELISNALKHAFPANQCGEIYITIHRGEADTCLLIVSDNGEGIPAQFNPETARTLGMRLIRSLVRQIDGQWELRKGNFGTEARVTFQIKETRDGSTSS